MSNSSVVWKRIILLAYATGAIAFGTRMCAGQDQPASAPGPDFLFGVNTHRIIELEPDTLPTIAEDGVMSIRDDLTWGKCETVKGVITIPDDYIKFINDADADGLIPLDVLDYSNKLYDGGTFPKTPEAIEAYAKYCEKVVSTFKGKIKYYQVWNEWDMCTGMNPAFKGQNDMESYVKLLSVVYPRIKAIDPSIIVLANAICTGDKTLKKALNLDVLKCCDAVDLHTYNYQYPDSYGQIDNWYTRMRGEDAILRAANGGKEFPLYVTEMGWPTQVGTMGVTEAAQADYMGRLYLVALTMPYLKGVWWYNFCDNGWSSGYSEHNYGMVRHDLTPKPSYFVMKDLTRLLKGAHFVERLDAVDPKIFLLKFKRDDGQWLMAAWSERKDTDGQITLVNSAQANAKFELTRLGNGTQERFFYATDKDPMLKFSLTLRQSPFVLEGDLQNATFAGLIQHKFPESKRTPIPSPDFPDYSLPLTEANLDKIQIDMSGEEVRRIFGLPSELYIEPADANGAQITYKYHNATTGHTDVIIVFKNGKVVQKEDLFNQK